MFSWISKLILNVEKTKCVLADAMRDDPTHWHFKTDDRLVFKDEQIDIRLNESSKTVLVFIRSPHQQMTFSLAEQALIYDAARELLVSKKKKAISAQEKRLMEILSAEDRKSLETI